MDTPTIVAPGTKRSRSGNGIMAPNVYTVILKMMMMVMMTMISEILSIAFLKDNYEVNNSTIMSYFL